MSIDENMAMVILMRQTFPLCFRDERYKTFEGNWDSGLPVTPTALCRNGFYYIGTYGRDCVQCFYCGGIVWDWEVGDDVATEHKRLHPYCPVFGEPDYDKRRLDAQN
jgi:hypothetical protein